MTIFDYATQHKGRVVDWPTESPPDPAEAIYRVRMGYDEEDEGLKWVDKFADMLEKVDTTRMTDFIIGAWTTDFGLRIGLVLSVSWTRSGAFVRFEHSTRRLCLRSSPPSRQRPASPGPQAL